MRPEGHFDWQRLHAEEHAGPAVVDCRRRMRLCLVGFALLLCVVLGRVIQLEVGHGAAFRSEAAKPLVRRQSVPGVRGRILARDGTVLAYDKEIPALAIHYRWLEEPPNRRWLRWVARSRLSRADRKDPRRVAEEEDRLRAERAQLARRLARLCGVSVERWNRRGRQIQARVERIAQSVNRRRAGPCSHDREPQSSGDSSTTPSPSLLGRIGSWALDLLRASMDEPPPEPIVVAEQLDYHVIVEDVPLKVVARIEAHPERYPGVKIVPRTRRAYPSGRLAAHLLGHLGAVEQQELEPGSSHAAYHPEDRVGRTGLQRRYEHLLRGRRGVAVELTDRSGRILASYRSRDPGVGRDLVLTLDLGLQRSAEALLQSALKRREILSPEAEPAGGAVVVMDVHSGAVVTAASAPGFDPNVFAGGQEAELRPVLSDPARPLFDRTIQMAVPPGSIFKIVTAAAMLDSSVVDPDEPFYCQGYLHRPDRWRCAIFLRDGVGHGEVTLLDAIAQSCNVYFFHHAGQLGPGPLVEWASRFGFGRHTGIDLPGEASGALPNPQSIRLSEGRPWRDADTQSLAIGQGSLRVTPVQVVCMLAAIANGGSLVTPHVVADLGLPELGDGQSTADLADLADDPIHLEPPRPIPGLDARALATIREGLNRVVADPSGTAHGTVYLDSVRIAGKTGTAQTGPGRAGQAWFAGYVPADAPKLAFVVVLEHAGDAAETAGPVANRLVRKMQQLGYFSRPPALAATRRFKSAATSDAIGR